MTVGDLSTYLSTYETITATDGLPSFKLRSGDDILAALAAADEPLTATVEKTPPACPFCHGKMKPGKGHKMGPKTGGPWVVCDDCGAQEPRPGTVRIVAMTEDVLRARLRDWPSLIPLKLNDSEVDAIVRAILGFDALADAVGEPG